MFYYGYLQVRDNLYGSTIGTQYSGSEPTNGLSMGVTSDPAKSGLIAKFSGLTLGTVPSKKLGNFYIRY